MNTIKKSKDTKNIELRLKGRSYKSQRFNSRMLTLGEKKILTLNDFADLA